MGKEQDTSSKDARQILTDHFQSVLESLPGGRNGEHLRTLATQAYFYAHPVLKDYPDLTHLITNSSELGGVLKEIDLNEIQPLLMHLLDKDPAEKTVLASVIDMTFFDKLTAGYAATSAVVASVGALPVAAGAYVAYRFSEKFVRRVFGKKSGSELDRLILTQSDLHDVLGGLSELKLCEALAIVRQVESYQTIMSNYRPEGAVYSFSLFGFDLPTKRIMDCATTVVEEFELNSFKRLLQKDNGGAGLSRYLYASYLINITEEHVKRLFETEACRDKYHYTMGLIALLEMINTLDRVMLMTNTQASWDNQVEACRKIYTLLTVVKVCDEKLMALLDENEQLELNNIFSLYLPPNLYSHMLNARVTTIDTEITHLISHGRIGYYLEGEKKSSALDGEVKDKLDACLSPIEPLLRLEGTSATDAPRLMDEGCSLPGDTDSTSSDDHYYDAQDQPAPDEDEEYEYVKDQPIATTRLTREELVGLASELKACLKKNAMRITASYGKSYQSQQAVQKKMAYLARCYVILDTLTFETEESSCINGNVLASLCVQVALVSRLETNTFSMITEGSCSALDTLISTKTCGSMSYKEIKEVLDKYELEALVSQAYFAKLVRCYDDSMWPVLCSALFHFEKGLCDKHVEIHREDREDTDLAESTFLSSFSVFFRIPTSEDIEYLKQKFHQLFGAQDQETSTPSASTDSMRLG